MGEVDAFHVPGFKCYFPASDHYPPALRGLPPGGVRGAHLLFARRKRGLKWEYKLQMRGEFGPAEQAALFEQVMKHKRRLLREWNAKVCLDRRD